MATFRKVYDVFGVRWLDIGRAFDEPDGSLRIELRSAPRGRELVVAQQVFGDRQNDPQRRTKTERTE